jgi:hypothetical protein
MHAAATPARSNSPRSSASRRSSRSSTDPCGRFAISMIPSTPNSRAFLITRSIGNVTCPGHTPP